MRSSRKVITRRDFLRETIYTSLVLATGVPLESQEKTKPAKMTKVVLIRDADATDVKGRINNKVIQRMLDQAVSSLFNKKDPLEAWKNLIKPKDVVGIKSNVWGPLPTPKEVEHAIKRRVLDAGVLEENIDIDDRGVLSSRNFIKSTALINVRPLRTHHWSGVGGCIKNYIMFVPYPPAYHGNACEDLAAIWKLPAVEGKTRLNILILLRPLFHGIGAHHFDLRYTWNYKGILVGTDPVALDSVGVHLLRAKRLNYFGEERPFRPLPRHITLADTKHKLGVSDLRQIELVKLGWKEEILI